MTEIVQIRRPVRLRLLWILPLWFAVASILGCSAAGHGGQLFFLGALAGVWASALVPGGAESSLGLLPTLLGGVPVLVLLGWLLDRLGASPWLWLGAALVSAAVAGFILLQGYPDIEVAVEHHGSLLAYVVCALQLGSYAATVIVLGIQTGRGRQGDWQ